MVLTEKGAWESTVAMRTGEFDADDSSIVKGLAEFVETFCNEAFFDVSAEKGVTYKIFVHRDIHDFALTEGLPADWASRVGVGCGL